MQLSSTSLFHFTPKFESVLGILLKGFKYCNLREELPFGPLSSSIFSSIADVIQYQQFVKAICFCDIPLSLVSDHINQYGRYFIGMSKEWGMKKGVTPIRYIHFDSPDIKDDTYRILTQGIQILQKFGGSMSKLIATFLYETRQINNVNDEVFDNLPPDVSRMISEMDEQYIRIVKHTIHSMAFLRIHRGEWEDRATGQIVERNFYDEREWRAVWVPSNGDYLMFELKDVDCVAVETEEEKDRVIEEVSQKVIPQELGIESTEQFYSKVKMYSELRSNR